MSLQQDRCSWSFGGTSTSFQPSGDQSCQNVCGWNTTSNVHMQPILLVGWCLPDNEQKGEPVTMKGFLNHPPAVFWVPFSRVTFMSEAEKQEAGYKRGKQGLGGKKGQLL